VNVVDLPEGSPEATPEYVDFSELRKSARRMSSSQSARALSGPCPSPNLVISPPRSAGADRLRKKDVEGPTFIGFPDVLSSPAFAVITIRSRESSLDSRHTSPSPPRDVQKLPSPCAESMPIVVPEQESTVASEGTGASTPTAPGKHASPSPASRAPTSYLAAALAANAKSKAAPQVRAPAGSPILPPPKKTTTSKTSTASKATASKPAKQATKSRRTSLASR